MATTSARHAGDDGSTPSGITYWSVSVLAAHVRGKDEDRVQIPDGPLVENKWAVRPMVGLLVCNQEIGVRIPGGPLHSAQPGKMPASIAAFRLYPHSTATPST